MISRHTWTVLLAAVTVCVCLPASAHGADYVYCGDDGGDNGSAGAFDIRAKRTPCTEARWVGRRFSDRAYEEGFPRRVGRFRCRPLEKMPDVGVAYVGKVLCTRDGGKRAIRFSTTI